MNKRLDVNERDSRFELLRIISMMMIVLAHYAWHGGYTQGNDLNRIISSFLVIGGKLGVDLFVIISAWFLVEKSSSSHKIFANTARLVLKVSIYSVAFYGIHVMLTNEVSIVGMLKSMMGVFYDYWFVIIYIFMFILSPYINRLIANLNREEHKQLVCILLAGMCLIPSILVGMNELTSELVGFLTIYIVVSYRKKYSESVVRNPRLGIVLSFLVIMISEILFDKYFQTYKGFMVYHSYSVFVVILAFSLLEVILKKEAFSNSLINQFATAMFGVYLFHENRYIRIPLWNTLQCPKFYESKLMIAHAILCLLVIMIIGLLIDRIYESIFKKVKRIVRMRRN